MLTQIIGVRYRNTNRTWSKVYYYEANRDIEMGDYVITHPDPYKVTRVVEAKVPPSPTIKYNPIVGQIIERR